MAFYSQQKNAIQSTSPTSSTSSTPVLDATNLNTHNNILSTKDSIQEFDTKSIMSINDETRSEVSVTKRSSFFFRKKTITTPTTSPNTISSDPWRSMENTLEKCGEWAQKALPVLLEIVKRGGRFDPKYLKCLRPSFRSG